MGIPNGCQVHISDFEAQLDLLSTHYRVLSLREVLDRLSRNKPLPPNTASLTFDDGFRNVATTAYPLLEKYQMLATVYLVTGFVGTRQPAWPDWVYYAVAETKAREISFEGATLRLNSVDDRRRAYRHISTNLKPRPRSERERILDDLRTQLGDLRVPDEHPVASLNWDEVHKLASTGLVDFGSHTHTHPILSRCSDEEQWDELKTSRDILIEHGVSADLFAYPNGTTADYTSSTQRMLRELGYQSAVSMRPGLNKRHQDIYALRRIGVGADTTIREFELRMAGL